MVRHPFLVRIFKGSNPFIPNYWKLIDVSINNIKIKKSMSYFSLLFFFISFLIILSAFLVITVKNPVHSVLFLVLVFLEATFILLLLEIEFLPLIFIIIYALKIIFLRMYIFIINGSTSISLTC